MHSPPTIFSSQTHPTASGKCLWVLFVLVCSSVSNSNAYPDARPRQDKPSEEITTLKIETPIERELSGFEEHHYQIALDAGQYARVVLEQKGVDAVLQLLGEDGKLIIELDNETRLQRAETLEVVATSVTNYRLVVKARYPKLTGGPYVLRMVELRLATENDRVLDEARRLLGQAWQLMSSAKFKEALPVATKALAFQERVLGPEHADLALTLNTIGGIDRFLVDFQSAEMFYMRGLRIAQKTLDPDHPLIARLLYNLGYNYSQKGDYTRAESLYRQGLAIRERSLGPEHPNVANILTELALLLIDTGDYTTPEPMLQRALRISESAFGPDSVDVARALNYLGICYATRGDYASAEPLFQRTLAYWEKTFGPNSGWVAIGLENLAELYLYMGDYDRSEPLYLRSIAINEKNNGPNHPDVLHCRANLGLLSYYRGDYVKAQSLYLSVLPTLEKVLGPTHPEIGFHLSKFAKVYSALKNYEKAEALYQRSIPIIEAYSGSNGPDLAAVFAGLAQVSVVQGNIAKAVASQARADAIIEHNLDTNLALGSERQKLAYMASLPEQMSQTISLHVHFAVNDPAARDLGAAAVLQRKGRVQDSLSHNLASLRDRFSAQDRELLDQLNRVTSRLAHLVLGSAQDAAPGQQKEIKTLEEQREKIEREISNRSTEFRAQTQPITLDSVRQLIPDGAALIEFAVYRPFDPKASNERTAYGDPRYVAYVIRRQGDVQWKELGDAKAIDDEIELFRQSLSDPQRKDMSQLARALDERVMQPVRPLLGDARQLLISPDGELNLVPFAAMVDEQQHYLIQNFSITYLTSGRDLLRMQVARESTNKPFVIADPLFGEPDHALLTKASSRPSGRNGRQRSITTGNDLSQVYFAPLDGTAQEARSIQALFPQANVLLGAEATESALKQVAAPPILHIATHGFFLSEPGAVATGSALAPLGINAKARIQNPLLRSGIALAGANLRRNSDKDDGILTALEASGLNLWGTKLVVLSACDTGVGEVHNGEGVYGLRRSFFLAGAESLVMSLWPASDYVTRQLMTSYYRNLKQGMGRGDALRQVQLNMLKHNPKLHPFYWANFIQSGEWANLYGKR